MEKAEPKAQMAAKTKYVSRTTSSQQYLQNIAECLNNIEVQDGSHILEVSSDCHKGLRAIFVEEQMQIVLTLNAIILTPCDPALHVAVPLAFLQTNVADPSTRGCRYVNSC